MQNAKEYYRPNVGIIVSNHSGQILWARRIDHSGWQFPQGGIHKDEQPLDAMFRELDEEVGLQPEQVEVVAQTRDWLSYRIPNRIALLRQKTASHKNSYFVGQKQKWFLLRLLCEDSLINLNATNNPEFDYWQWVSYWYPLGQVVPFKQNVYRKVLMELVRHLPH